MVLLVACVVTIPIVAGVQLARAEDVAGPELRVSILSIVDHPRFDTMRLGLADRLIEAQAALPERVAIERISVDADLARLDDEAMRLARGSSKVLVAFSAPAARAAALVPTAKPVVFAAVARDEAEVLIRERRAPTVIGIVEKPPEGEQIEPVRRVLPSVRRIILPFDSGRDAATATARDFAALATAKGYVPVLRAVAADAPDPLADVSASATALVLIPALMTPPAVESLLASTERQALPTMGGDAAIVARGALATVIHDAYATGRVVGNVVLGLLTDPARQQAGLREAVADHVVINVDSAGRLGRALPSGILDGAGTLIDSAGSGPPRPSAKPAAPVGRRRNTAE